MPTYLTGPTQLFGAAATVVDTVPKHAQGTRAQDLDGGQYVYGQTKDTILQFDYCFFDGEFNADQSAADVIGIGGVAMADGVEDGYGWFQIYGAGHVTVAAAVASDVPLYLTATAGQLDDAAVAGDFVFGIYSSAAAGAQGVVACFLNYPMTSDGAYLT